MQRKGIEWRDLVRQRGVPGDLPRFGDQIQGRSRQRRHVQRLAYMAGGLRPTGVRVDVGAAGGEIQQRNTAQYG